MAVAVAWAAPRRTSAASPRAPAGQAQGVQDDRLARPGLAGQRGQARPEGQVQGLDQHDVADAQADQHGRKRMTAEKRPGTCSKPQDAVD